MVAKVGSIGGEFKFTQVGNDYEISNSTATGVFWKTYPVIIITEDSRCGKQMSEKDFSVIFRILEDRSEAPSKLAGIKEDECCPILQMIDRMHQELVESSKRQFYFAEGIRDEDLRINFAATALPHIGFQHSKVLMYNYEHIILYCCYTLVKDIKELKSYKESFIIIKELQQLIQVFNVLFPDKSLPVHNGIDVESYLLDLEKAVNLQAPIRFDNDKSRRRWEDCYSSNKDFKELRAAILAHRQAAVLETPKAKQANLPEVKRANLNDESRRRWERCYSRIKECNELLAAQQANLIDQLKSENVRLQKENERLEGEIDTGQLTEYFNGVRQALKFRTFNLTAANLAPMDQIDTAIDEVIKEMTEDGDSDKIITILTGLLGNLKAYPRTHVVIETAIAKTKEIFGE